MENELPHLARNTGAVEWYTPIHIIDAARKAMGSIDFDPCSSRAANQIVRANHFITAEDNALTVEWNNPAYKNVWMNPPYARELLLPIVQKFVKYWDAGYFENAIILVNNSSDTEWFRTLAEYCDMMMFTYKRIKFLKPEGEMGSPLQGQTLFVFSRNGILHPFALAFHGIAWGAIPWGAI